MKVLKLSAQGLPQSWISLEQAVIHYAANEVRWEMGAEVAVFRGGHNALTGEQSVIAVNSIIGTKGVPKINLFNVRPMLTNSKLFVRDRHICAYCGDQFVSSKLSRDHVHPVSKGGPDEWTNVVTSCIKCNTHKGAKSLDQCGLQLLYVPYEPNHYENMILQNRAILADQMEYLLSGVPKHSRVRDLM